MKTGKKYTFYTLKDAMPYIHSDWWEDAIKNKEVILSLNPSGALISHDALNLFEVIEPFQLIDIDLRIKEDEIEGVPELDDEQKADIIEGAIIMSNRDDINN